MKYDAIFIVSASREITLSHKSEIYEFFDAKTRDFKSPYFVHGDARGGDQFAEDFCTDRGIDFGRIPYFDEFRSAGGRARNYSLMWHGIGMKLMAPDATLKLLALPKKGQNPGGTRHMISLCKRHRISIARLEIEIPEAA